MSCRGFQRRREMLSLDTRSLCCTRAKPDPQTDGGWPRFNGEVVAAARLHSIERPHPPLLKEAHSGHHRPQRGRAALHAVLHQQRNRYSDLLSRAEEGRWDARKSARADAARNDALAKLGLTTGPARCRPRSGRTAIGEHGKSELHPAVFLRSAPPKSSRRQDPQQASFRGGPQRPGGRFQEPFRRAA